MTDESYKFIRTTTGVMASHPRLSRPCLAKVNYYESPCGEKITLIAVSGWNLSNLPVPTLTISRQEWRNIPEDECNNMVETRAALALLNFNT